MATFNIKSIALKWFYFTSASFFVYGEFCHLFMKQLGFSPRQIGLTSLFGVQHLFIPVLLFMGDKFRARKLVLWMVTIVSVICYLLSLLPLVVSLPTCFGWPSISNQSAETMATVQSTYRNGSMHSEYFQQDSDSTTQPWQTKNLYNPTISIDSYQNVPFMSKLFLVMTVSRSLVTFLTGAVLSLASVATVSYLGEERANFGAYYMWMHVGTSISIVASAVIAELIRISICGNEVYGYFGSLIVAAILVPLSMISLPCLEFKYKTDRTINWREVKRVMFNGHYVYMYMLTIFLGICVSFQVMWEFWYLDGLEARPLVIGGAALIRRPILAMSNFGSNYMIKRIGDQYTVCASFLLFAVSFLCLSFTRVYWYVLAIDILQGMGSGLAQSAFTVHFSKAGSKASSGVILGLQQMCFMFGVDAGAMILGVLFQAMGTQKTLLLFALTTAIMLGILLFYLKCSKQANEYEKLPDDDNDDDNCDNDDDDDGDDTLFWSHFESKYN